MKDLTNHGEHIDAMTGLKGLACIAVMLNHFSGAFCAAGDRPWESYPYLTFLYNGTFMLYVFYLVSGFFCAYSLFNKEFGKMHLAKKLFTRYFRLVVPVLVVCLVVSMFQRLNLYNAYDQMKAITYSTRGENDALNYYVVWPLLDTVRTALSAPLIKTTKFSFVFWMLPYIYRGFFVSIILALIVSLMKTTPAVCVLMSSFVVFYIEAQYEMISFGVGVLVAFLYVRSSDGKWYKFSLRHILGLICVVVAVLCGSYWPNSEPRTAFCERLISCLQDYRPIFIVGAAALVIGVLISNPLNKIMSTKAMAFLGKISLGVYLFHDMLQIVVGANIFLIIYRLTSSTLIARGFALLSSTVAVIAAGFMVYKYLDPLTNLLIARMWRGITEHQNG